MVNRGRGRAERKIDEVTAELRARFKNKFGDPAELLAQPGLQRAIDTLHPDCSKRHRDVWLVAPCKDLDDKMPLKVVQSEEIACVVLAARPTRDITIG